jgi:TrpR family trp operon transcriptional repressor
MNKNFNDDFNADFQELAIALSKMSSPKEISQFLNEICSPAECQSIALRWRLMKLLSLGETQRAIASKLHISLCKITRGARYLKDENSVLRREINKVSHKKKNN